MPLSAGEKLGPYEILAPIGAGGMGEVYRARDTRLGRDVALKVSQEKFTERFEQEARSIAALNHPHICHLYDVGPNYLVMELVDGKPLKGPLPIEKAVEFAGQILDALAAAHRKTITHRDLKPANILVTKDGIKLVDFGLAKQTARLNEDDATKALTQQGQIEGTLQYMAPEQLQGKEADPRSDLFSFGCVLYEMLSGKRAFEGAVPASVIAAILAREPEPLEVVEPLDRIIRRSLAKDPDQRFQTARDLKAALSWAMEASPAAPADQRSQPSNKLPWVVAGVSTLALIIAGVLFYNAARPSPSRPLIHLDAEIAANAPMATSGNMLALSPDGTRLAVTLRGEAGKMRLHTRLLNQPEVTPLAGTDNASYPFFSPDGEWIGFFADNKLKKIAVAGGAAVVLCDAPSARGASWGDNGNIVAALESRGVLSLIPSGGGTPVPVTKLNPSEYSHRWPQFLPGSQAILFTTNTHGSNYDDANIEVISLQTGARKTVERGGYSPRYLATSNGTGHLIYLHQSTLFAVPFSPGRLAATGSPVPVLDDVSGDNIYGGNYSFAEASSGLGTFVYLSGNGQGTWSISWVDSSGNSQPLHAPLGRYFTPRFSPDGKRLAFSMANGPGEDIWVKDINRDAPSRLSFLSGTNRWPVWTPDGQTIVFHSSNPAAPGMYSTSSDGSGEAQRLADKLEQYPYSFSPDGKRLAFYDPGGGGTPAIFIAPVEVIPGHGPSGIRLGKAELFQRTTFTEVLPAFSPDSHWLAYRSNESGIFEVYVRPFPGPGGKWQVSTGGGNFPTWSHDGRELLYETPDGRVMSATVTARANSFEASKPRMWAEARMRNIGIYPNFDLTPDGKRLAVMLADDANGERSATHLTFLLNFFDELRRRVPVSK